MSQAVKCQQLLTIRYSPTGQLLPGNDKELLPVAKANQARVFDRFYPVHSKVKRRKVLDETLWYSLLWPLDEAVS